MGHRDVVKLAAQLTTKGGEVTESDLSMRRFSNHRQYFDIEDFRDYTRCGRTARKVSGLATIRRPAVEGRARREFRVNVAAKEMNAEIARLAKQMTATGNRALGEAGRALRDKKR